MGLDIIKAKISTEQTENYIKLSSTEILENKSYKDLFNKFQKFVQTDVDKYIDVEASRKKFELCEEWDLVGYEFQCDSDLDIVVFGRGEGDDYESERFPYNSLVLKDEKVYILYYKDIGYQRKNCKSEIYTDIFGCDSEEFYYSLAIVTDNSVLDLVKTYAIEGSELESWTLEDDEFVIFDF